MKSQRWAEIRMTVAPPSGQWRNACVVTVDIALVSVSWWLFISQSVSLRLAAIVLLAMAMLHCYLLLHEATHGALAKRRALNNSIGHITGWLIVLPFLPRQSSHVMHHVWAGHPVGDPANARMIARFRVLTPRAAFWINLIWRTWLPMFALNDRIGLWKVGLTGSPNATRGRLRMERQSIFYAVIGYVLLALGLWLNGTLRQFLEWYLPALFLLLMLEELINLPHHAEAPLLANDEPPLPLFEQHKVSHSCRSIPFWSRFALLNFNLHVAHHLFPTAPWYCLPKLSQEIDKYCDGCATGTAQTDEFRWSLTRRRRRLLGLMGHYFRGGGDDPKSRVGRMHVKK
jgi:fatty acid desaturase